jgi:hypothetical protein
MGAAQVAQAAPASAVPQPEQKRPAAAAPHEGQVVVGGVVAGVVIARKLPRDAMLVNRDAAPRASRRPTTRQLW